MINLSEPFLNNDEIKNVTKCLKTGWLSSSGTFVKKFENNLKKITKSKYVVSCQSGSSALNLSFRILKIKKNTEVLIPTITFIAPTNSILINDCHPVFFDVDENNCLDVKKFTKFLVEEVKIIKKKSINIKSKKVISAIIIPHIFGNITIMDEIVKLCKKYNIKIIEDVAEAICVYAKKGKFKNKHAGTIGDIGCMSFNINKVITAGGGGAFLFKDIKKAKYARYLINQAKDDSKLFIHNEVGFNLSMNNIQAAIGCAQLKKINFFLRNKKKKFLRNKNKFKKSSIFKILNPSKNAKSNYWLNILKTNNNNSYKIFKLLEKKKIESRLLWYPMHLLKPFRRFQKYQINQAIKNYNSHLCLPSSISLKTHEIDKIVNIVSQNDQK